MCPGDGDAPPAAAVFGILGSAAIQLANCCFMNWKVTTTFFWGGNAKFERIRNSGVKQAANKQTWTLV